MKVFSSGLFANECMEMGSLGIKICSRGLWGIDENGG